MTNPSECLAAQIGLLIAENDPKLCDYDKTSQKLWGFEATAFGDALEDAYDSYNHLLMALSHVKATSMDGAAVQVAAVLSLKAKLAMDQEYSRTERDEITRAISRLVYSALGVMMDRVEADQFEGAVQALAPSMHDNWINPQTRIREMERKRGSSAQTTEAA